MKSLNTTPCAYRLRLRRSPLLATLVAGVSILAASAANAALPPQTAATVALFSSDPLNTVSHPTVATLFSNGPDIGGLAVASASFGAIGTDVAVSFNDFRATAAFLGSSEAYFLDNLTIIAPSSGTVVFSMKLEGTASSNMPGVVSPRLQFGFNAFTDRGGSRIDISSMRDGFPNALLRAPALAFVSGETVTVSALMLADVLQIAPSFGGPLFAGVMYGNTATLAGIEVFDAFGAPVSDFTISSGSGTAYGRFGVLGPPTTSVPEPGVWLMLIGGFTLTGAALRRRGSSVRRAGLATI